MGALPRALGVTRVSEGVREQDLLLHAGAAVARARGREKGQRAGGDQGRDLEGIGHLESEPREEPRGAPEGILRLGLFGGLDFLQ